MSGSARELKILEGILATNLKQIFSGTAPLWSEIKVDGNGDSTLYVNYTKASAFATNDVAAFVRLRDVGAGLPTAMRSQSHASGDFLHSSVLPQILYEAPALFSSTHAKLIFCLAHILGGTFGCDTELTVATNGNLIVIKGMVDTTTAAGATDANVSTALSTIVPVCGRGLVGGM